MYKLKAKSYKLNKGMTYVELIVVLSIFSVMTSIVLFNYNGFQSKIDIRVLANDIALKIVEAQKAAVSGKLPPSYPADWKPSYGVSFNKSNTPDTDDIPLNEKFIYFVDLTSDNTFFPPCFGNLECLNSINITKGNFIEKIEVVRLNGVSNDFNNLVVSFTRPNSGAIIKSGPFSVGNDVDYVKITISSPGTDQIKSYIRVYVSGRIQID